MRAGSGCLPQSRLLCVAAAAATGNMAEEYQYGETPHGIGTAAGDMCGYGLHGGVLFLLVGHDTRRTLIGHGMRGGSTLRAELRHETGCSPEFTQKAGWFTQASKLYTKT